jgi:hypothetical protein
MRRSLVVSLALLAIVRSPAVAQTCMGLASFSTAPMQVTANGQFGDLANTFGATVGYGIPSSVYGNLGVSTTSYDGIDGSTLGLGAHVGYQMAVGKARQVQVCPNASVGIGKGPNDDAAGVDQSSRSATVGLNVGTVLGANPRMKIIPTAGLSYAYGKSKAEDDAGATLFEFSDSYGLAQLGVGIVLNQNISVRPSVDIPLGLEGSDPTFGLTLGYNFGSSRTAAHHRR